MVAFAAFQVSSSVKPMFYQRKLSSSSDTSTSTTLHLQSIPSTHSSTVLSYKNTDDDDDNSVKEVVIKKKRRVVSSTPIKNLFAVDTIEDYAEFMEQHKTDLVVIRFFAPWCKACASIAPSYNRLARRHPEAFFLDIACTAKNTHLYEGLNVPYVPYGHIYNSDDLIDEMKMSKSNWKVFEAAVLDMIRGYCNLDDYEKRQETISFSF